MRHLLRHDHTRQALLVVILLQHLDLGLFDNVGSPERPSNDTSFTSSVCTMDLGQKDLAPVFTSCRCVATVAYLAQDVKALYIHFRVPDGATASLNVSKGP